MPSGKNLDWGGWKLDQKEGIYILDSGRNTIASVVKTDFVARLWAQAIGKASGNYYVTLIERVQLRTAAEWLCTDHGVGKQSWRRLLLNSAQIGNILIRGAKRNPDVTDQNTAWGYGK